MCATGATHVRNEIDPEDNEHCFCVCSEIQLPVVGEQKALCSWK